MCAASLSLPNSNIFDKGKLKKSTYDKIYAPQMMEPMFYSVENGVGEVKNACYQYFLICPH